MQRLALETRPAMASEVGPALRIVLRHQGLAATDEAIVDFLRYAVRRGINPSDLWVAVESGQMLAAVLPVSSPGKTLLLLGPSDLPAGATEAYGHLLARVIDAYRASGPLTAQVLIDPGQGDLLRACASAGFGLMARLDYLQLNPGQAVRVGAPPAGLGFRPYSDGEARLFEETIAGTYEGSLDCPAVNGLRAMSDVMAGHRAAGPFDPECWLLVLWQGRPAGNLLLTAPSAGETMELVYLGLLPWARGKRLGRALVREAVELARRRNAGQLALAVDAANTPAVRLYHACGFHRVNSKVALLRLIGGPSTDPAPRQVPGQADELPAVP